MSPTLTVTKWRARKYWRDFAAIAVIHTVMSTAFYYSALHGPDLRPLLAAALVCFAAIVVLLLRHLRLGLVLMGVGGLLGYGADLWGVGNGFWAYRSDMVTVHLLHPGLGGIPLEIVASYFLSAVWMTQILESLFDRETAMVKDTYRQGLPLVRGWRLLVPGLACLVAAPTALAWDPMYVQPLAYLGLGLLLTALVPASARHVAWLFGGLVAGGGFFFELFCTGRLDPAVVLWTHQTPAWETNRPLGALLGYAGAGLTLAAAYLLLLRMPSLRTTRGTD